MYFGFGRHKLTVRLPLMARSVPLKDLISVVQPSAQIDLALRTERQGQFIEGLEARHVRKGVQVDNDRVVYVPYFYDRHYIDFRLGLLEYTKSISQWKSQQVLRKQRALQAALFGDIRFICYERSDQMEEFFRATNSLALAQRSQPFATLPLDTDFQKDSRDAAEKGKLICYALCHGDTAISYLYCSIVARSIVYQFLGFDPRFERFSPGLILLWMVIQQEFRRKRYLFFDFTKGNGQQKRIFSSGKVTCADMFDLRKTLSTLALVIGHSVICRISYSIERRVQRR